MQCFQLMNHSWSLENNWMSWCLRCRESLWIQRLSSYQLSFHALMFSLRSIWLVCNGRDPSHGRPDTQQMLWRTPKTHSSGKNTSVIIYTDQKHSPHARSTVSHTRTSIKSVSVCVYIYSFIPILLPKATYKSDRIQHFTLWNSAEE